eukprot:6180214-Pleurochrysis_carterae.AAC.4
MIDEVACLHSKPLTNTSHCTLQKVENKIIPANASPPPSAAISTRQKNAGVERVGLLLDLSQVNICKTVPNIDHSQ